MNSSWRSRSNIISSLRKEAILKLGLSVHYLQHVFLSELKEEGHGIETITIYDLEDLESKNPGFIRLKGADVICPRDNMIGAAYVDCIRGDDFVGEANVMLSYTWGYRVVDIVHALVAKCREDGRDAKRTYVWICCFCNNQHRVSEQQTVSFEEFRNTFYNTVTGVGTVWSMMTPWNHPQYLKRVWCVFEFYIANTQNGVISEVIMPEEEKEKMMASLSDIDSLFAALSRTKIENSSSSRPEDKSNILGMVEERLGCMELNVKVNTTIRKWISKVLLNEVDNETITRKGHCYTDELMLNIAHSLRKLGFLDEAFVIFRNCLELQVESLGMCNLDVAVSYDNIGTILSQKGQYKEALTIARKALTIRQQALGEDHPDTATSYNNVGLVLSRLRRVSYALEMHRKCLKIREKTLGKNHLDTARSYNSIGNSIIFLEQKMKNTMKPWTCIKSV